MLVAIAIVALVLDAVDGQVARRTGTSSGLGARFDMEVDAFLILVLSVYVARSMGAWVLAIGAMRYAFVVASWALRWMRGPLPPRYWRKVVAATQGVVLVVVAADVLPAPLTVAALAVGARTARRVVRPRRRVAVAAPRSRAAAVRRLRCATGTAPGRVAGTGVVARWFVGVRRMFEPLTD